MPSFIASSSSWFEKKFPNFNKVVFFRLFKAIYSIMAAIKKLVTKTRVEIQNQEGKNFVVIKSGI